MNPRVFVLAVSVLVMMGCQREPQQASSSKRMASNSIAIPHGDALAGRQAFLDLKCHACHYVEGGEFPTPVASPVVPIVLGAAQAQQSRPRLVESIMYPSCRIPAGVPDVQSGELSRMGDYRSAMTVAQLLDLVEFIKSLDRGPIRTGQELAIAG